MSTMFDSLLLEAVNKTDSGLLQMLSYIHSDLQENADGSGAGMLQSESGMEHRRVIAQYVQHALYIYQAELGFRYRRAHNERIWKFPLQDEPEIVMAIHEGCCPTCGRMESEGVQLTVSSAEAPWAAGSGWHCYDLKCPCGGRHAAEPNESGNDWGAW